MRFERESEVLETIVRSLHFIVNARHTIEEFCPGNGTAWLFVLNFLLFLH